MRNGACPPVRRLAQWLEAAGCLLFGEDFGTGRVDGLSQWVGDHPVILYNDVAPADRVRLTLAHELGRLLDLKREYGVSMQALVERAYQLDLLSPTQRTSMYKMFSARGWRTREPGSEDIAPECPMLAQSTGQSLSARGLSPQEVASIAGFSEPARNTLRAHVLAELARVLDGPRP